MAMKRTFSLKKTVTVFLSAGLFCLGSLQAEEESGYSRWVESINQTAAELNEKTLITHDPVKGLIMDHLLVDLGIAMYGFRYWHWGTRSFHMADEGWFGEDTATGGSDKTGHFYMTYLLSRVLSSRMEDRGLPLEQANLYGSLSALLAMTLLEVGDATSSYGFSKEDLLCDTLGSLSSYLLRSYPKVDDFIDIRMEYRLNSHYLHHGDHTTDYSNMRHLIAFNLSGFDALKATPLRFLEIQAGYYTRGFRKFDTMPKSRQVFIGIGFSLKELAKESGIKPLENLFEFYQPGHTYVDTKLWYDKEDR